MYVDQPGAWRTALSFACGLLLIQHLRGLWENLRLNFWSRRSDMARAGRLLGLVLVAGVQCLILTWWLQVVYVLG